MAIYVTIDLPATPSQLVAFLSGAVELGATLIDADGPLLVAHIGFPDDQDTNDLDTDDLDVHQDPVVRPFDRDATRARAAAGI